MNKFLKFIIKYLILLLIIIILGLYVKIQLNGFKNNIIENPIINNKNEIQNTLDGDNELNIIIEGTLPSDNDLLINQILNKEDADKLNKTINELSYDNLLNNYKDYLIIDNTKLSSLKLRGGYLYILNEVKNNNEIINKLFNKEKISGIKILFNQDKIILINYDNSLTNKDLNIDISTLE